VRDRRDILNQVDLQAGGLKRPQCGFPSGSWPFDIDVNGSDAMFHGLLGSVIRCHLRGKRGTLPGALKPLCAGAGPGDYISLGIGDRDDRIVECRLDMGDPDLNILFNLLFLYSLPFGHISSFALLEIVTSFKADELHKMSTQI
jgi:hypothetical protein